MATDDPYDILGVSRDASRADIKSAYRELALEHHPDHNPGDDASEETFKRVSWAYQVLSDPKKRRRYDRDGLGGLGGLGRGGGRPDFSMRRGLQAFREFIEMFGAFLGGGEADGRRPVPGEDLETTVSVDLEDVLEGTTVTRRVPAVRSCPDCGGDGVAPGASSDPCPDCEGRGQTRPSMMSIREICDRCGGTGTIPSEACRTCGGTGRERYTRDVEFDVPAGVRHGQKLRRRGEGAPGQFGGSPGDLLAEVEVETPPEIDRSGRDLHTEVAISFTKASLGGRVRVSTVESDVWMEVPAGTSAGDTFRLRGKGLPDLRGGARGDLLVDVRIETPVDLTDRQRARVERARAEDSDGASRSIGQRIRDFIPGASRGE